MFIYCGNWKQYAEIASDPGIQKYGELEKTQLIKARQTHGIYHQIPWHELSIHDELTCGAIIPT